MRIGILSIFTFLIFSVSFMSVEASDIKLGGIKFRTNGAFNTEIGMAGVKKTKGKNSFYHKKTPIYNDKVGTSARAEIYNESISKVALKAVAKAGKTELIKIDMGKSVNERGRYVIIGYKSPLEIASSLNMPENDKIRNYLIEQGDRGRIVTSVALCYDHEIVKESNLNNRMNLFSKKIVGDILLGTTASIDSTASNKSVLRYSDGAVFAFRFSRLVWGKSKTGRIEVYDLIPDDPRFLGLSDRPDFIPDGKTYDPSELLEKKN